MFRFRERCFVFLLALLITGCGPGVQKTQDAKQVNLDTTVGNLAGFSAFEPIPVRGYGIVAGLYGTGSAECPPTLRKQLEKYVWQQLPEGSKINPKEFIESRDTAVVEINGLLPALSLAGEHFDIQLKPLSETQTTSLRGGRLYTAELKEKSRFVAFDVYAKTLADAHGPVFTFTGGADNEQRYCIFGGGLVQQTVTVSLVLQEPDFYTAGVVRNRINERFGPGTANAISDRQIQISFPKGYRNNKIKFLRLISALYLSEQDEQKKTRIDNLISQLQQQTEKVSVEIAIEAIGRPALDKLNALLEHPDPAVRFSAARILLNIGDQRGLDVLQKVIEDSQSPRRLEAIEAVGQNAKPKEVLILLAPLLDEERIDIRLAAYEQLLGRNCPIIKRTNIANNFFLDRVLCGGPKAIYAYRKDSPRLVLFGSPLYCEKEKEIFVTLEDGAITINARPEDKSISITRRHPSKPRVIGPLKSGFEAGEIILTLCQDSETDQSDNSRPGLGIAYPQVIELLEKMCQSQAVIAQFIPGPLSETLSLPKEMEK